ncbi:hypothetical protein QP095_10360, partial [Aerococcus urinae]|nr:hypothetical protein [Aerococcus urinae]
RPAFHEVVTLARGEREGDLGGFPGRHGKDLTIRRQRFLGNEGGGNVVSIIRFVDDFLARNRVGSFFIAVVGQGHGEGHRPVHLAQ